MIQVKLTKEEVVDIIEMLRKQINMVTWDYDQGYYDCAIIDIIGTRDTLNILERKLLRKISVDKGISPEELKQ